VVLRSAAGGESLIHGRVGNEVGELPAVVDGMAERDAGDGRKSSLHIGEVARKMMEGEFPA
jgi:hypothetical protein